MAVRGWHGVVAALALAISAILPQAASAEIVKVAFSGVLTTVVNNTYDDPNIPSGMFAVGDPFSGLLTWDTTTPGDPDLPGTSYSLSGFTLTIGGVDYSDRFLPRSINIDPDGTVEFLTGGADQGGFASLVLNLGSGFTGYPAPADLAGRSASFSYTDFYPGGGDLTGTATFAIAAVPEPATWLLMIAGIGVVAIGLRGRRAGAALVPTAG